MDDVATGRRPAHAAAAAARGRRPLTLLADVESQQQQQEQEHEQEHQAQPVHEDGQQERSPTTVAIDGNEANSPRLHRWRTAARNTALQLDVSVFSINMGTGVSSILLHQMPYQFHGIKTLANIVFALNVVLFCIFLAISCFRYILWPTLLPVTLLDPSQSLYIGTFSMGLSTIVNMCALSAAPAWGGKGGTFAIFTWVLWWINASIALSTCILIPFFQHTRQTHTLERLSGAWLLPLVSTIVVSASGAFVADVLEDHHARLTVIVSYILFGTGFTTACIVMTLYYLRLIVYKIPPGALIPSAFVPLGPCGQGSFCLLKLSSIVYGLSASSGIGLTSAIVDPAEAKVIALAIYGVTMPIGLVIWGFGLVWFVLATLTIFDLALVSKLSFNLAWWAFTFPLGVWCTATDQLAVELDSAAFRVIGTVCSVLEIVLWLMVSGLTVRNAIKGELFFTSDFARQGDWPPKFVPPARKYDYEPRERSSSRSRSLTRPFFSRSSRPPSLMGLPRSVSRGRRPAPSSVKERVGPWLPE